MTANMRSMLALAMTLVRYASSLTPPPPSRITRHVVRGREILVKRDDQYRLTHAYGGGVSGNKARKLYGFAAEGPGDRVAAVASLGGHQSNALPSLAALCRARGLPFVYLCKPVPRWLRHTPAGNYARALALGVELVPLKAADYRRCVEDARFRGAVLRDAADAAGVPEDGAIRFVPQGGACGDAEVGVSMLADELAAELAGDAAVVVPGGTGTTALFLARRLADVAPGVAVHVVPCATSAAELERQMNSLDGRTGGDGTLPAVLPAPAGGRFGAPAARDLELWRELADAGLHVDLVYAPRAWVALLAALDGAALAGRDVCYVHCGGVEGVATQLNRYRHAGLLDASSDADPWRRDVPAAGTSS